MSLGHESQRATDGPSPGRAAAPAWRVAAAAACRHHGQHLRQPRHSLISPTERSEPERRLKYSRPRLSAASAAAAAKLHRENASPRQHILVASRFGLAALPRRPCCSAPPPLPSPSTYVASRGQSCSPLCKLSTCFPTHALQIALSWCGTALPQHGAARLGKPAAPRLYVFWRGGCPGRPQRQQCPVFGLFGDV